MYLDCRYSHQLRQRGDSVAKDWVPRSNDSTAGADIARLNYARDNREASVHLSPWQPLTTGTSMFRAVAPFLLGISSHPSWISLA